MRDAFRARGWGGLRCLLGMAAIGAIAGIGAPNAATAASSQIPKNYKQRIAADIRTWEDAAQVKSGQITAPYEKWMGLWYGGTRPVVCLVLIKPLLFGNIGPAIYIVYFDDSKPEFIRQGKTSPAPIEGCGSQPLAAFAELAPRRK